MSKEAEYRGFAATCLDLSSKTDDAADKTRLLMMAEAWLSLSDRLKHVASQIADHPLVVETLGQYGAAEAE
jgi:hypothetical protein